MANGYTKGHSEAIIGEHLARDRQKRDRVVIARASRWPRAARRTWTLTIMVASSPLFVEPTLRVLL